MILVGFDCSNCIHKRPKKDGWICACDAFPEGIPYEVYYGKPSELAECNDGIKYEMDRRK